MHYVGKCSMLFVDCQCHCQRVKCQLQTPTPRKEGRPRKAKSERGSGLRPGSRRRTTTAFSIDSDLLGYATSLDSHCAELYSCILSLATSRESHMHHRDSTRLGYTTSCTFCMPVDLKMIAWVLRQRHAHNSRLPHRW